MLKKEKDNSFHYQQADVKRVTYKQCSPGAEEKTTPEESKDSNPQ